jgi:hypothetical protein
VKPLTLRPQHIGEHRCNQLCRSKETDCTDRHAAPALSTGAIHFSLVEIPPASFDVHRRAPLLPCISLTSVLIQPLTLSMPSTTPGLRVGDVPPFQESR